MPKKMNKCEGICEEKWEAMKPWNSSRQVELLNIKKTSFLEETQRKKITTPVKCVNHRVYIFVLYLNSVMHRTDIQITYTHRNVLYSKFMSPYMNF